MAFGAQALDEFGIDAVCDLIRGGISQKDIAARVGVDQATLSRWISTNTQRSAQAKSARAETAILWDEQAQREIEKADGFFTLARAKELAHHYRWRAPKINPRDYGDKQQVEHSGDQSLLELAMTAVGRRKPTETPK